MKNKNLFGWPIEKLKEWCLYWLVVGTGTFILVFLVTCTWIGVDVKEQCKIAKGKYEGDCVEALAQVLDDEENSLRERNMATWALGQLGDERALEMLKKYYTGNIPDREPYDKTLSQYELKKAIKLIESGLNLTAFVWRYNLPE
jgi:hypothetical protein